MMSSAVRAPLAKRERREEAETLWLTATRAKEIAEFTMLAAEAAGRVMILEAAHTLDTALDAAVILLEPVV